MTVRDLRRLLDCTPDDAAVVLRLYDAEACDIVFREIQDLAVRYSLLDDESATARVILGSNIFGDCD